MDLLFSVLVILFYGVANLCKSSRDELVSATVEVDKASNSRVETGHSKARSTTYVLGNNLFAKREKRAYHKILDEMNLR